MAKSQVVTGKTPIELRSSEIGNAGGQNMKPMGETDNKNHHELRVTSSASCFIRDVYEEGDDDLS